MAGNYGGELWLTVIGGTVAGTRGITRMVWGAMTK